MAIVLRTLLLIVGFTLVINPCVAQENFIQGYIINTEGDTLRGEIDYRNWVAPPERISFRNSSQSITSWTPLQIKGFGVKADHYESGIVEREVSPSQDKELSDNKEFKIQIDTVFLQVLVKGDKSLYLFKEDITAPQFYIFNEGRYELLRFKRFVAVKNGVREVFGNNQFRYQLISYLNDCSVLSNELSDLKYHIKSLKRIFEKYYGCSKKQVIFSRRETVTHNFGLVGGVSFSSLDFSSPMPFFTDTRLYLTEGEFETSVSPVGGVSWEIVFPRNLGRWSIYNELIFTSFNTVGKYEKRNTSGDYQVNTMHIGYGVTKLNLMGRYNYQLRRGRLFAVAGVFKGGIKVTQNEWEQQASQSGTVSQNSGIAFTAKRGVSGIIVGAGVELGKFSMIVRYEKSHAPSDDPNHPSETSTINALLGFRFYQLNKISK